MRRHTRAGVAGGEIVIVVDDSGHYRLYLDHHESGVQVIMAMSVVALALSSLVSCHPRCHGCCQVLFMEQERVDVWERYELMKRQLQKTKRALALHETNNNHQQPGPGQQSQSQGPRQGGADQQDEEQAPPPIAPPPQKGKGETMLVSVVSPQNQTKQPPVTCQKRMSSAVQ